MAVQNSFKLQTLQRTPHREHVHDWELKPSSAQAFRSLSEISWKTWEVEAELHWPLSLEGRQKASAKNQFVCLTSTITQLKKQIIYIITSITQTTNTTRTPVYILHDLKSDLAIQAHSGVKQKTQRTRAVSEACTCCLEVSLLKPIWALKFQSISISILSQYRERRHLPPKSTPGQSECLKIPCALCLRKSPTNKT